MIILAIVLAVVGLGAGFGTNAAITKRKLGAAEDQAKKELEKAKRETSKILAEAREEAAKITEESRREEQSRRKELKELEARLVQREETIDKKFDDLEKRS